MIVPPEIAYGAVALLGLGLCVFIAFWRAEQAHAERLERVLADSLAERDALLADNAALARELYAARRPQPFALPRLPAREFGAMLRGWPRA